MLALVENLQRRDLDYIERPRAAKAHAAVPSEPGAGRPPHRQEPVRRRKQAAHPAPSAVRLQALREHHLTERHARALLRLPDEEERLRVIGLIVQGEWTVAKTEQYIDARLTPKVPQRRELGTFVLRDVRVFLELHRPSA